jgi:hypothetical protein
MVHDGAILVEQAKALRVSTDELLGVKPIRETLSPKTARLLKRLRRVEELRPPTRPPSSSSSTPCSIPGGAPPYRGNARRANQPPEEPRAPSARHAAWRPREEPRGSPAAANNRISLAFSQRPMGACRCQRC